MQIPLGASGLHALVADDSPVRIVGHSAARSQPLVEILDTAHGRRRSGSGYTETEIGARLRYLTHTQEEVLAGIRLRIEQADADSGLVATSIITVFEHGGINAWTEVFNGGTSTINLEAVSSFAIELDATVSSAELLVANSGWLSENRWHSEPLIDRLSDVDIPFHGQNPRSRTFESNVGSWSSGDKLPTAVLVTSAKSVGWQIENNGSWYWELSQRHESVALLLFGPTLQEHGWSELLAAGASFRSVPVSIVHVEGREADVFGAMTAHRRTLRRSGQSELLPIIYNDFLNTLMGDPTTEKVLPLVRAAAAAGAEVYCLDAGWYDLDGDWWYSVGEWTESPHRFPGGLREVTDAITGEGMRVGLWLEPEVIGVRSPLAATLPDEAFFHRSGIKVEEHGRYHLDFRHPAARDHMNNVVDRLVNDYGASYLKLDYNITSGLGTDRLGSAGAGLLGHGRALLGWIEGLTERHPGLLLENCASGAMRADYSMLARTHIQSTSDQQNPLLAAPIIAAALASVLPEQSGNWASPQPDMTDHEIIWTMCSGAAGRLYLSGHLDKLTEQQWLLLSEGVALHKELREHLAEAIPSWPAGLPDHQSGAYALRLSGKTLDWVTLWLHPGKQVIIPGLRPGQFSQIYPQGASQLNIEEHSDGTAITSVANQPIGAVLQIA